MIKVRCFRIEVRFVRENKDSISSQSHRNCIGHHILNFLDGSNALNVFLLIRYCFFDLGKQ